MGTLQNITVAGLVADLGLTGHKGLAVARNSGDHTKLDVAVTPPAWVLLGDGTLFTTDLVGTTVQAPTADGSYHLYVDALVRVTDTVPTWSIAATAPGATGLAVADVTVASHVISAAVARDEGLRSLPVQPSAIPAPAGVPVLYGPYAVDHTDIPTDGSTKALWTPAVGDVLLRLYSAHRGAVNWDHGTISLGTTGSFGLFAANITLPTGDDFFEGWAYDYHHPSSAAVEVQFSNPSGPPATMGHVELYALIARAVSP